MTNLACRELQIDNMKLNQAATSSLVRALQHGVKSLRMGYGGRVRLRIQTLLEYGGTGRCGKMECRYDTWGIYKEEMKTWAETVNWDAIMDPSWEEMDMNGYIMLMIRRRPRTPPPPRRRPRPRGIRRYEY